MKVIGAALVVPTSGSISYPATAGPLLRVATWNVANRPNDATEREAFTTVLRAIGPLDVLSLVETDVRWAQEVAPLLHVTGLADIFNSVSHFRGHTQGIIHITRLQLTDTYRFAWTQSPLIKAHQPSFFYGKRLQIPAVPSCLPAVELNNRMRLSCSISFVSPARPRRKVQPYWFFAQSSILTNGA